MSSELRTIVVAVVAKFASLPLPPPWRMFAVTISLVIGEEFLFILVADNDDDDDDDDDDDIALEQT